MRKNLYARCHKKLELTFRALSWIIISYLGQSASNLECSYYSTNTARWNYMGFAVLQRNKTFRYYTANTKFSHLDPRIFLDSSLSTSSSTTPAINRGSSNNSNSPTPIPDVVHYPATKIARNEHHGSLETSKTEKNNSKWP